MAKILEKHDNDKEYIFTCPVCGTIFTEKGRDVERNRIVSDCSFGIRYPITCPNCLIKKIVTDLTEYKKEGNG